VSTRWAKAALCTLAVATALVVPTSARTGASVAVAEPPALTLLNQTSFVSPDQPWFNMTLGVGHEVASGGGLHASLTFYGRIDDASELQQAINSAPSNAVLLRLSDVPVNNGPAGATATACVTVLPDSEATAPSSGTGSCASSSAGATGTVTLGCAPDTGTCGDVYPVSVALYHQGATNPIERFTTFLTYQEPSGPGGSGRPLRVGVVVPVSTGGFVTMTGALTDHHDVATTVEVSPTAVSRVLETRTKDGLRALAQLATLESEQLIDQSYVPVNVAALSEAGLTGEIGQQLQRGDALLRSAGLKPSTGPWIDTSSTFSQGDSNDLGTGVQVAGSPQLVLSDGDLSGSGVANLTFAQPFTLDLGHGSTIPAAAANSTLGSRFTADPRNPVLGAEQLLASLSFVHFENAFLSQPRGVVVVPPSDWRPSGSFMEALLRGLSGNPALLPVTLAQFFAQVPVGGNREPSVRHLQAGPAGRGISNAAAGKIAVDRQELTSFSNAVSGSPPEMVTLNDQLLTTEARILKPGQRTATLGAYTKSFAGETDQITLATERTITFTSRRAPIPITVLSSAPYAVHVVVTLASDKFVFPDGSTQHLLLNRPTTSVRVEAQARTSGDRLPIEVTLRTPNGQFVIARTVLTVQSTAISFVGVALTILAGAVLLAWWARTWRRSRRRRPRAH
jgi:hypothetical protein